MYEIWVNATGQVVETLEGPWSVVESRIRDLNKQGLGCSARKISIPKPVQPYNRVYKPVLDLDQVVYIAYQREGTSLEVVGCDYDYTRLQHQCPDARIDVWK